MARLRAASTLDQHSSGCSRSDSRISRETTRVSASASQLQAAHSSARQPGACRCTSLTMRTSAQIWQTSSFFFFTAYLLEHPTSELLSRGQRWMHLKRHARLRATTRALQTARARRQALRALEMDSRTAQTQYQANPADAASLLAWKQAHQLLQQPNAAASQAAAVQAAVVWQHYGEQSTFWFYHLARERQAQTTITQLRTTAEHSITLDTLQSTQQAAQALQTYYSAGTPEGLFAPPQTSLVAQDRLLAALDLHLSPSQQQQGEGAAGDCSISLEDLTKALGSLPRSKAPGFNGTAATALYTDILQRLQARIARWSGFRLSRQSPRSQTGVGGHVHIPWHLHTGARADPQAALHVSVHLRGGQPASGGRSSTSVPQQRCFQQCTPAGWHCPCGKEFPPNLFWTFRSTQNSISPHIYGIAKPVKLSFQ